MHLPRFQASARAGTSLRVARSKAPRFHHRPNEERPYRAFGYPFVPALYIAGASVILILLFAYRTSTTVPGLVIVLIGVPVYFFLKRRVAPRD